VKQDHSSSFSLVLGWAIEKFKESEKRSAIGAFATARSYQYMNEVRMSNIFFFTHK